MNAWNHLNEMDIYGAASFNANISLHVNFFLLLLPFGRFEFSYIDILLFAPSNRAIWQREKNNNNNKKKENAITIRCNYVITQQSRRSAQAQYAMPAMHFMELL